MRIGVKLLLTYLTLVALLAAASALLLPHWVEGAVIEAEQSRLERQAILLADRFSASIRTRQGAASLSIRLILAFVDELVADESVLIVDPRGVILRTTRPELRGKQIPLEPSHGQSTNTWLPGPTRLTLPRVEGLGPVILAVAPLESEASSLRGHYVAVIRDMTFIENLSSPITQRVTILIAIGLIASFVAAGLVSREMVKRLQATGSAARILAEGELSTRAPVKGNDEIAELAGHFNHMAARIETLVEGLRRSERSRQELLIMVSHELRTPMTSIVGFAEALRDGVVPDEARKQRYYQIIASEATRLNRLINDLFAVAKLEAGQMALQLQVMPVAPWLREFSERLKPTAAEQGVELILQISPEAESARIYGDRDRLDQILENLTGNALRFAPIGSAIEIQAVVRQEEAVITISDQGPGIAADEQDHLFDRFFQGSSKGRGHRGAGLGLAIVKTLVEAHGGQVDVISQPGSGSRFEIRFKRSE